MESGQLNFYLVNLQASVGQDLPSESNHMIKGIDTESNVYNVGLDMVG